MFANIMENKYREGEFVYAKENPSLRLIVRRYLDDIYYCKIPNEPDRKELVYFERELIDKTTADH